MNRKESYKDLNKWRKTCREQAKRYYGKTSYAKNGGARYASEEMELILNRDISDHEIAERLNRSVKAIQIKRSRLRSEEANL